MYPQTVHLFLQTIGNNCIFEIPVYTYVSVIGVKKLYESNSNKSFQTNYINMKKQLFLMVLVATVIASCTKKLNSDDSAKTEAKVDSLLKLMTLEEKIGQMNQLNSGKISDHKELIKNGQIGSILNEVDPAKINEFQHIAVEESRLKIPIIFARDVIHGFKTIFPIPLGQAASWNPSIIETGARVAAIESSEVGVRWTFAPMIDISRDPRWGRIAESLGEDPYLTSTLGAAMVRGFQGEKLSNPSSIAACLKHFACYGAAEGGRDYNTTFIPEVTLRDVYLPSFHAAVKAGAASLMSSFNEINGVPSSGNEFLLKKILRDEWKFDGVVVSDWASVAEMVTHGFCTDGKDAALKSANAGLDMEMASGLYIKDLANLVKEGKVKESVIDNAVRNVLRMKYRLGLFENPYTTIVAKSSSYAPDHLKQAKEAATQSVVLLKNENQTLPLKENIKTIAVIGPLADAPNDQLGTWIFDGDDSCTQTPLMALKQTLEGKVKINFEKALEYSRDNSRANFGKALEAVRRSDVAIVFVGEESILSGEAGSRADISLPGAQSQLIEEIKKTNKPMILVVMAGRPLTMEKEFAMANAVLYAWHPGTMGGPALADLIFGKSVPSGKLPVTFPKMVGQVPIYYSHKNTGRPAQEPLGLMTNIPAGAKQFSKGSSSYYLDAGAKPLYPFGYGLSYTTFAYNNLKLSESKLKLGNYLTVTCEITNTGAYEAVDVVQLYTRDLVGSLTRPVKELKGFQRVSLKPREKKTVEFQLTTEDLAFCNAEFKTVTEPGDFKLWVGGSSEEGLEADFSVIQ
jgi:beta-glucosidase